MKNLFLIVCLFAVLIQTGYTSPTDFDAYVLAEDKVYRLPGDPSADTQYLFQLKGSYNQGEGLVVDGSHNVYLYATSTDDWTKPATIDVYIRYPERGSDNWANTYSGGWGWKGPPNTMGYIGFAWYSHTGVNVAVAKSPMEPNVNKTLSSQNCYWDSHSIASEYAAGTIIPLKNPTTGADNSKYPATITAVPTGPAYFERSLLQAAGGHASDTGSFLTPPRNASHDTTWQKQYYQAGGEFGNQAHYDNGGDWWRIPNESFYHSGFRQCIGAGTPSGWGGTVSSTWTSQGFMTMYEELWKKDHNIRRYSFDDSAGTNTAQNLTVPVLSGNLNDEGPVCTYSDTMTIMGTLTGCQNGCGKGSLSQMLSPTQQIVNTVFTRDGKGILMQREDSNAVTSCSLKIDNVPYQTSDFVGVSVTTGHTLCGDINMNSSSRYVGVSAKKIKHEVKTDLEFVYLLNDAIVTDWLESAGLPTSNLSITMASVSDMYYLKGAMIYAYDSAQKTVYQFTRDETQNFSTSSADPIWLRNGKTNDAVSYLIAKSGDVVDAIASDGVGNFYWLKDARFPDTDLDLDGLWRDDPEDLLGGAPEDLSVSSSSIFGENPFHLNTYNNDIGDTIIDGDYMDKNSISSFILDDESVPSMYRTRFRYKQSQTKTCWRRDYYSGVTSSAGEVSAGTNVWYQDVYVPVSENIITDGNKNSYTRKQIVGIINQDPNKWSFGPLLLEVASDTINKVRLAVINVAKAPEVFGFPAKIDIEKPYIVSGKNTIPAGNDFQTRLPENKVYQFRLENSPSFDGFGNNTRSREEYLLDLNHNSIKGHFPSTISESSSGTKDIKYFWRIVRIEEEFDADRKRTSYKRVRVADKLNTTSTSISSLLTAGKYEIWCAAKYRFYDYSQLPADATIEDKNSVQSDWLYNDIGHTYGSSPAQLSGVVHKGFNPGPMAFDLTLPLGVEDSHTWGGKQAWVRRTIGGDKFQGLDMEEPDTSPSAEDAGYTFLWSVRTIEIDKQAEMSFDEGGPGLITCKKNAALNPGISNIPEPDVVKLKTIFDYTYTNSSGSSVQLQTEAKSSPQSAYLNVIKVPQGITYEFNIAEIIGTASNDRPVCMPFYPGQANNTTRPTLLTWTPGSIIPQDNDPTDDLLFDRVRDNIVGLSNNPQQAWYYDRTIAMFMDDVITPNSGSWVSDANNKWTSPYLIPPRFTQYKSYYGLLANGSLKIAPFSWVLYNGDGLNSDDPMIIPDVFSSNGTRLPSIRWDDKWDIETGTVRDHYGANVKWTWELVMKMTETHPHYNTVHPNERMESVDNGEKEFSIPAKKYSDSVLQKKFEYCSSPGLYKLTCTMNRSFTYKTYDQVAYAYNPALGTTDEFLTEVDVNNKIQISGFAYVFVSPNLENAEQKPRIVFADSPVEYIVNSGQKDAAFETVDNVSLTDAYSSSALSPSMIRIIVEDPVGPFSSGVFEPAQKLADVFAAEGETAPAWADSFVGISNYQVNLNHDSGNFQNNYLGANGFPGFPEYPGGASTSDAAFSDYLNDYKITSASSTINNTAIGQFPAGTMINAKGLIPAEVLAIRGNDYHPGSNFEDKETSSYVMFSLNPTKIKHFSIGLENTKFKTLDLSPFGYSTASDVTNTIPFGLGTYMKPDGSVHGKSLSYSLGLISGGHNKTEYENSSSSYEFEHDISAVPPAAQIADFSMKLKVRDTLLPNAIIVLTETGTGRKIYIPENISGKYHGLNLDSGDIYDPGLVSSCQTPFTNIKVSSGGNDYTASTDLTVPLYSMSGPFTGTNIYDSIVAGSVNGSEAGAWGFPYYQSGLTHNVNDSNRFSTFQTGSSANVQLFCTTNETGSITFPQVNDGSDLSIFEDNQYRIGIYAFDDVNPSIPSVLEFSNFNYIIPETGTSAYKKLRSIVYCRIYYEDEGPTKLIWEFPTDDDIANEVTSAWPVPTGTGGDVLRNIFNPRKSGNLIIEGHVKTLSCNPDATAGEVDNLLGGNWDEGSKPQRTRYFKYALTCYDTQVNVKTLER